MCTVLFIFIIIPVLAVILGIVCLMDWLIFGKWLGRKNEKCKSFALCTISWLSLSFRLPRKMKICGMKYWKMGYLLMLLSPAALVTYTAVLAVRQDYLGASISDDNVPYKTHKDLVAITGMEDFPSFTYSHNEVEPWDGTTIIYYKFDKPLSSMYAKKLKSLSKTTDNYLWKTESSSYVMRRGWDGKYIKSPIKGIEADNIVLTITQQGFTILCKYDLSHFIKMFADPKLLDKETGVTFQKYQIVNYEGSASRDVSVTTYLRLDKKPSRDFIKQLEKSPKWEKQKDGCFKCNLDSTGYWKGVIVNANSRIVIANYSDY